MKQEYRSKNIEARIPSPKILYSIFYIRYSNYYNRYNHEA
jgi:hypothetical protein